MRHPAYLLGTTLLVAAAMQLTEPKPSSDQTQAQPVHEMRFNTVQRASLAPTTASMESLRPAQQQRWVF